MTDPRLIAELAQRSGQLPLHYELYAFSILAAPMPEEIDDLTSVLTAVSEVAQSLFPAAKAVLFGSQPAGLSLPGSDLDLVILGVPPLLANPSVGFTKREGEVIAGNLKQLLKALREKGLCSKGKSFVVQKAKVPIIKCNMKVPNKNRWIAADVSMGVVNGAEAVHYAVQQVQALPPLRPLLLFLKAILKEHQLNEVRTGGLSSYCLLNMVIAHLQMEGFPLAALLDSRGSQITFETALQMAFPRQLAAAAAHSALEGAQLLDFDLGWLLLGFLRRFGAAFNWERDGVSVRQGGVVPKAEFWCKMGPDRADRLALEDPQEPGNEIGGGSYMMPAVSKVFQDAHDHLIRSVSQWQQGKLAAVSDADRWTAIQMEGSHRSPAKRSSQPMRSLQIDEVLDVPWALSESLQKQRQPVVHRARATPKARAQAGSQGSGAKSKGHLPAHVRRKLGMAEKKGGKPSKREPRVLRSEDKKITKRQAKPRKAAKAKRGTDGSKAAAAGKASAASPKQKKLTKRAAARLAARSASKAATRAK